MESGILYTEKQLRVLHIPGYSQKTNGDERYNYHKQLEVRKEALTQGKIVDSLSNQVTYYLLFRHEGWHFIM